MLKKLILFFVVSFMTNAYSDNTLTNSETLKLYEQGNYEKFRQLTKPQWGSGSGHSLYNLGNSYYREGKVGEAVAAYLEARRLLPRDADVKENLKFVHSKIKDKLDTKENRGLLGVLLFWDGILNTKELFYLSIIILFVGLSLLAVKPFVKEKFSSVAPACYFVLFLGVGLMFAFSYSILNESYWGAVISKKASVYSGPSTQNTVLFQLSEGAPFKALDKRDGWYKINLSDGKKGWLRQKDSKSHGF